MSKVIYDSMFEILKFQNDFEQKVCDMGFNFEYGSGIFGEYCQKVSDNCDKTIVESMGLKTLVEHGTINMNGIEYPVEIEVLYRPEDADMDFSITVDNFYSDILYKAVYQDPTGEFKDLFWQAVVEMDSIAKDKINEMFDTVVIGLIRDKG